MSLDIAHPHAFWLLVLLPLLALTLRWSLAQMTRVQRIVCLLVRSIIVLLLIFALAGIRLPWFSKEVAVVFAVDRSGSISENAAKAARDYITQAVTHSKPGDSAVAIGFAKQVLPLTVDQSQWPEQGQRDETDIANALQFASAVFPEGKAKRVVLLSDGNDTALHASAAAQALARAGVELYTVPLQNPFHPEVLVERLTLPATLHESEPFDITATVRSNIETKLTARLYADGFTQSEQELTVKPGKNTVTFRNVQPGEGSSTYQVEINPEKDTIAENNKASATAAVKGKPKVLIVDPDETKLSALTTALHNAKIEASVRPVKGLPTSLEDLQGYDALILSDVSALNMSRDQMALYQQWVQDFGGGFAMLGGENSYGVGGYFRTPIEAMLPVRTEHDDRAEEPTVAILIILDSSGSMTAQVAGQTKISLADQGAVLALDVLQPRDLFGVMAVDTRVHQIAPLARHENKADVAQNILRITAGGGGIYIYTSLLEAFAELRDINAKIKHVILFSDAADAEEKSAGEMPDGTQGPGGNAVDLVNQMAAARITTSVVGLGTAADKDTEFLKQLAQTGGGRFYLTSDALTLPQIFSTETMRVAQSSLVEEPVNAVPVKQNAPVLGGIDWSQAPLLLGYNVTKLKPTADLLLATEKGDPLLATWRYGAGEVAAFTSDAKSRWAPEWINGWPGYGKFWAQLVRSILRRGDSSGLQLQTTERDGRLEVQIDAVSPDGSFRNELPLLVRATTQEGSPLESATARQIAPGRYRADIGVSGSGTTWISVDSPTARDASASVGYTAPVAAEYLTDATNENALASWAEMGRGVYNPKPEQVFARPAVGTRRFADLTNIFLGLALLLLPVDVWLRRRSWSGGGG